jgi:hypothetical protein
MADTNFIFLARFCCVMAERNKNSFTMLDCKEHAFSHSIDSFNKHSLSGHHARHLRYRPVWENRCHGVIKPQVAKF